MILYRGCLKSCNYSCSYCPFAKHGMSAKELEKDKKRWLAFIENFQKQAEKADIRAMMVTPYGEALIHPWYWEGLAKISGLSRMEAVGAQTNLGFQISNSFSVFEKSGGNYKKLCLWATFHPEMTTVKEFASKCRKIAAEGVRISAGAVGAPENLKLLRRLRWELPKEIYFWINKMEGMKRSYTDDEIRAFLEMDPYFYRELQPHPSDAEECVERLFIEGDGRLRLCNISNAFQTESNGRMCSRKRCSCYLAYGGRKNLVNQMLFGPWPLFRIPRRPKAVFLDIVGTLYPNGKERAGCYTREISQEIQDALRVLSVKEQTLLFFATTLPYEDARKRCRPIWHLFSGGIFAGGAHILFCGISMISVPDMHSVQKEYIYNIDEAIVKKLEPLQQVFRFRMLVYRKRRQCYKITLFRAHRKSWNGEEAEEVMAYLPQPLRNQVRYFIEDRCMQVISAEADKANGMKMICEWLHLPVSDIFAAGDSYEDIKMMQLIER